jgi:flavin prenyltransferase
MKLLIGSTGRTLRSLDSVAAGAQSLPRGQRWTATFSSSNFQSPRTKKTKESPEVRPKKFLCGFSQRSRNFSVSSTCREPVSSPSQHPLSFPEDNIKLSKPRRKRIVVGITGATGTLLAIQLLRILKALDIETHLIMSKWALATMKYETSMNEAEVRSLATRNYTMKDMAAPPSSGSFLHDGMIVVPCSMKTLAAIRVGYCDDLISRSADVCLKERRNLVLAIRETPLSDIHLENMLALRKAGAVIFPPVPAFYTRPQTIDDLIMQSVGRMLDALGIHTDGFERWDGFQKG